ncbi:MAG: hypothetical protein WA838_14165 [Xanthobacteraceae bacterium]
MAENTPGIEINRDPAARTSWANQLHREDRTIRHEERAMGKFNGGHITHGEQKALNQQRTPSAAKLGGEQFRAGGSPQRAPL